MYIKCAYFAPKFAPKFAQNLQKMCISLPHLGGKNGSIEQKKLLFW